MVIFAPAGFPLSDLAAHVETARHMMARYPAPAGQSVATGAVTLALRSPA